MVNATQMAKAFGKRPNDWLSLPSTKEFLDELITTRKSCSCDYQPVITKKGGEWYHDKSKYSSKEVDVFRYNQKGFDIIKDIFFNRFG